MSRLKRVQKNSRNNQRSPQTPSHKAPSTKLSKFSDSTKEHSVCAPADLAMRIIGLPVLIDRSKMAAAVADVREAVQKVSNGGTKHKKLLINLQELMDLLNGDTFEPGIFDVLQSLIVKDLQKV
jgi:hypothetical protein